MIILPLAIEGKNQKLRLRKECPCFLVWPTRNPTVVLEQHSKTASHGLNFTWPRGQVLQQPAWLPIPWLRWQRHGRLQQDEH